MSKVLWLCCWAAAACTAGWGQAAVRHGGRAHVAPVQAPAASASAVLGPDAQAALNALVARAAVIFAGHVLAVSPGDGFVDTRFRIDEPVRGCNKTGIYVLREWEGLWSGQPARYRVGERLLMLLTARGASGMSAPVGGDEGIIPIAASASEPLADARGVAPAEDGSVAADITGMTADLRWVQARAARTRAVPVNAEPREPGEPESPAQRWVATPAMAATVGTSSWQPTVAAVLAALRGTGASGPGAPEPGTGSAHDPE